MFKKIVSCAAAFVLALGGLSALPFEGVIDTAVTAKASGGGISYYTIGDFRCSSMDDKQLTIIGYNGNDKDIVIPEELEGRKVTSIGPAVFNDNSNLSSINIPNSIKWIGDRAFENCTKLENIAIPDSITSIGFNAFKGTPWIEKNPLIIINNVLMYVSSKKGDFIIPNGITEIDEYAFSSCEELTRITIPDSVISIGECAFYGCSSLTSITIPNSVTSIGYKAFGNCTRLESVVISDSITRIKASVFENCKSLTRISIPNGVKEIGMQAFKDCINLTDITIPDSVKTIDKSAFDGTPWIENNPLIIVNKTVIDGSSCEGDIIIPNGIISIGEGAFANDDYLFYGINNDSIKSIIIPESVTSISDMAFFFCFGLTSMNIPKSVRSIGDGVFYGCLNLTSITIPNSVTSIGVQAFAGCDNLTIKCYSGSAAEKYAKENNIKYKLIGAKVSALNVKADKTVFGYTGKAKAPTVTIKDGSYTLKQGTDYTLSYKNNKNIGTGTVTVTGKGNYTGTKNLSFTIIPSNVGGFKAASTSARAVKLSWNKVNGAGGYIVYQYNNSTKKWVRIAKTGNVNTYTVKSLKAGTTYKYAVKAYKTVGGKDYTSAKYPTITTSTKPAKVSFKAAAASKAVKFSWSKVTGATNYIVYYRVKGTSSWKNVKVGSGVTSRTISGLVKGKTYEVTVKAVRTVNKVNYNGAYDVKTVKVK